MPPYRIDFIDRTNHMSRPAEIVEYTGDFEAIEKAAQFVDGHDVELWESKSPCHAISSQPKKVERGYRSCPQ